MRQNPVLFLQLLEIGFLLTDRLNSRRTFDVSLVDLFVYDRPLRTGPLHRRFNYERASSHQRM
jgi:hypothetical protein